MHERMEDYVLDIFQNAVEAGSSRVEVELAEEDSVIRFRVRDNGPGMDERTLRQALDPFYTEAGKHPGRRVGLGLPFLQQAAVQTGGTFHLDSRPGQGTTVEWSFPLAHPDTPPLGDVPRLLCALMNFPGEQEVIIERRRGQEGYTLRRTELREALGSLEDVGALGLMEQFIQSQEESLGENYG